MTQTFRNDSASLAKDAKPDDGWLDFQSENERTIASERTSDVELDKHSNETSLLRAQATDTIELKGRTHHEDEESASEPSLAPEERADKDAVLADNEYKGKERGKMIPSPKFHSVPDINQIKHEQIPERGSMPQILER